MYPSAWHQTEYWYRQEVVFLGLLFDFQWYGFAIHREFEWAVIQHKTAVVAYSLQGYFALRDVFSQPSMGSKRVPSVVFCVYQLMLAAITYVVLYSCTSKHLTRPLIQAHASARRIRRARPSWPTPFLCLRLVNICLWPYRILDMECQWLGEQDRQPRLRRWYSCPYFFRNSSTRHLLLSKKAPWIWDRWTSLCASQYHLRGSRNRFPLVWLVWYVK